MYTENSSAKHECHDENVFLKADRALSKLNFLFHFNWKINWSEIDLKKSKQTIIGMVVILAIQIIRVFFVWFEIIYLMEETILLICRMIYLVLFNF